MSTCTLHAEWSGDRPGLDAYACLARVRAGLIAVRFTNARRMSAATHDDCPLDLLPQLSRSHRVSLGLWRAMIGGGGSPARAVTAAIRIASRWKIGRSLLHFFLQALFITRCATVQHRLVLYLHILIIPIAMGRRAAAQVCSDDQVGLA